jgi:hypothetical protein
MTKLIAAIVLAASTAVAAPRSGELQQVGLCTVLMRWQEFSGKTIRLKAFFQEGAEQSALYDPACRNGQLLVAVSPTAHVEGKKRTLRRLLAKTGRARVVLEGVFRGPELAPIDPKLPEAIKEKLKGTRLRYGHLASFDMDIQVTRIVEAERVGQ